MINYQDIYDHTKVCPQADFCGGCIYQSVSYKEQLEQKNKVALKLMDKHEINTSVYQGIVPAYTCYSYRNKMEYTFGDVEKGGELELGMHKKGCFMSIITTDCCQLVPVQFNDILRSTLEFCRSKGYKFYHRKTHEGLLRNLVVRCGVRTGEILVDIVTSSNSDFDDQEFIKVLLALDLGDMNIVGILHTYNDSVADAVIDERTEILYGRDYYNEEILGLKFKVKMFAFFQTNIDAVERLYSDALDIIPDIDGKVVYDLYCGTGTISQLMASKAKDVYGVEIVQDSVDSAIYNTDLNGINNCHYICGDVKNKLDELEKKPDVIVVDPPRAGLHDKVVDMLASYDIPELLYISCNFKTLCINLDRFKMYGYEPTYIKIYDNFPMTKHVETVCLMSRREKK